MGDRGNVCIREATEDTRFDVYLYTHWRGSDLPNLVREALAQRQRWTDTPYLARIIFDVIKGDDNGATGFGISARVCDDENPTVVVDCDSQTVAIVRKAPQGMIPVDYPERRVSFEAFVKGDR